MENEYYVSYKYLGNKDKDIGEYSNWFILGVSYVNSGKELIDVIYHEVKYVIEEKYNLEQDDISDDDIIILFMKELSNG